jgi:hypothetical protein
MLLHVIIAVSPVHSDLHSRRRRKSRGDLVQDLPIRATVHMQDRHRNVAVNEETSRVTGLATAPGKENCVPQLNLEAWLRCHLTLALLLGVLVGTRTRTRTHAREHRRGVQHTGRAR